MTRIREEEDWSKIVTFYTPPVFSAPAGFDTVGISWRCEGVWCW